MAWPVADRGVDHRERLCLDDVVLATQGQRVQCVDVRAWNVHTLNTLALSGQNNIVQTRSLAMVHAAIHDAVNAIEQRHKPYAFSFSAPSASPEAAIAAAAHGVLLGVIPNFGTPTQQATALAAANATYASSIAMIPERPARQEGVLVGAAAAAAVLAVRAGDGARLAEIPYVPLEGPGFWQPTPNPNPPDPASGGPGLAPALLPGWGNVMPFTLRSGRQFRPSGPLPLFTRRYAREYNEVQSIGQRLSTTRTAEQSEIARFCTKALRWGGTESRGSSRSHACSISGSRRGSSRS